MKFYKILLLVSIVQGCIPGKTLTVASWIEQLNASPVQKRGLWEGCMAANAREFAPTSVRHLSTISLDGDSVSNGQYKTSWQYAYYYCHINKSVFSGNYTRDDWNMMGFKGDSINFKGEG